MKKYGYQIKTARLNKGYSQEQLANELFVTKQSISKYENNHSIPSKEIKEKLEEILEIKLIESDHRFNVKEKRLVYVLLSAVVILVIGLVFTTINIVSLNNDYQVLSSNYDQLSQDYLASLEQTTVTYNGVQITYRDDYYFEDNNLYISLLIHNTNDSSYYLDADIFSINDLTSDDVNLNLVYGTDSAVLNGNNIQSNETYACYLRIHKIFIADYFNENELNLYYAETFITSIDIETN